MKYNLNFIVNPNSPPYPNEIATRLNGVKNIRGECIVIHELDENIYNNLSIHELRRLNVLAYGLDKDRLIDSTELIDTNTNANTETDPEIKNEIEKIQKRNTLIWNKYVIVELRMKKWGHYKDLCQTCNNYLDMNNIYKCCKCWRTRCCSSKCLEKCKHDCIN
jgi:hypothetical protein